VRTGANDPTRPFKEDVVEMGSTRSRPATPIASIHGLVMRHPSRSTDVVSSMSMVEMRRVRGGIQAAYEALGYRAKMHLAPLVGAAVALLSDFFYASNAQAQILILLAVAIIVGELVDRGEHKKHAQCRRSVAAFVRSILDRSLNLTRTDHVHAGDLLSLRRVATRAHAGAIQTIAGFGGPAHTLSRVLWSVATSFETEVGRCYGKLPARDQSRIDALADALKLAAARAGEMVNAPLGVDRAAASTRLYGDLASALGAIVTRGDELDSRFDAAGHRAAAAQRDAADATRRGREWDAAEILRANARQATETLQRDGPLPYDDLGALAERIRAARDVGLHVSSEAFAAATDAVRSAHRRVIYGDLFEALETVEKARRGELGPEGISAARLLLERVWGDVVVLQQIQEDSSQ